jgi:DNA-binding LacI/PurR family transcriptional regulator
MEEFSMPQNQSSPATLRTVADYVGLAPCSISAVLNNSPAAHGIPQHTKERIFHAVRQLNYSPNLAARGLRTKRTQMVAAITSDLGDARTARIIAGVESFLSQKGYLLMIAACRPMQEAGDSAQLLRRGIEGVITVDATPPRTIALPSVFIEVASNALADPATPLARERLTALGEAAAQSLLAQIEQKTAHLTRIALDLEPMARRLDAPVPTDRPSAAAFSD